MSRFNRSASFVITLVAIVSNTALAIQALAASRSIKWEPEFEWDSSTDTWRVDGIKVVWGLLLAYFVSAATVGAVGFVGVVKVRGLASAYLDVNLIAYAEQTLICSLLSRLLHRRLFLLHIRYICQCLRCLPWIDSHWYL